jgi:hypothetical protein
VISAEATVPVVRSKNIKAWPKHDDGGAARYLGLVDVLTRHHDTDAHFAAYSKPDIRRRLSTRATEHGDVAMVLVVFDIDGPNHKADDAWWDVERAKIFDLLDDHPGGFVYRTRGGYRLVYRASSIRIVDDTDRYAWWCLYVAWCHYLRRRYRIDADPSCKDWTRLYRAPHATRDEGAEPEDLETIGDPRGVGAWGCVLGADDIAAGEEREPPKVKRAGEVRSSDYRGPGRLLTAFARRGWLGDEIEPGKYAARCPWESAHSIGSTFDTSTVMWERDPARGDLGHFHCSHRSCEGRSLKDVIALFTDEELENHRPNTTIATTTTSSTSSTVPTGISVEIKTTTPQLPPLASEVFLSDAFTRPRRTYRTGFPDLDDIIGGGIKSRQLTTIAGPTGKGKTGLVGTIAAALAAQGEPVLWITTELGDDEQSARFASICSRARGRGGMPDDYLSLRIAPTEGAATLGKLPLYVVNLDDPDGDPFVIMHNHVAAITAATDKVPIVVVDYMQVLAAEDSERRRMSVTQVATKLRRLARNLDAAVIAISSVSRAYYGPGARQKKKSGEPEDPRDWLAAAKESGDVEYASAVFAYLDTDDVVTQLGESSARLIVAKSRGGTLGFVGMKFHGPSGLFVPARESVEAMKDRRTTTPQSNHDAVKAKVRNALRKRKQPVTSRNALVMLIGGRKSEALAVIDEMFEAGELEQAAPREPITLAEPDAGGDDE